LTFSSSTAKTERMKLTITRALLAGAAAIFCLGGVLHTAAFFSNASSVIEASSVKSFFGHELKVLWLADSTTLICLALICGLLSVKPDSVTRPLLFLLALVPASTTALLYGFLGPFFAAHMLLLGTLMLLAAAATNNGRREAIAADPAWKS
jgi:hypothetical protein